MAVATYNFEWEQGSDLYMNLIYKSGALATPVDLTNYKLRMDVFSDTTRIFTFNSSDIAESGVDTVGNTDNEAVLGSDGTINILVPRALTLPAGAVGQQLATGKSVFQYDIFLRDPSGLQSKLLTGTIKVNKSYTLWA